MILGQHLTQYSVFSVLSVNTCHITKGAGKNVDSLQWGRGIRWTLKPQQAKVYVHSQPPVSNPWVSLGDISLKGWNLKTGLVEAMRGGWEVKSTGCSSRGLGFNSQHQLSIIHLRLWHPFLATVGTKHGYWVQTHMQTTILHTVTEEPTPPSPYTIRSLESYGGFNGCTHSWSINMGSQLMALLRGLGEVVA